MCRWSLPQEPKLDWGKLMANQHKELERLSTLYQKGLEGAGVKYFEARGKVTGPHSVEVGGHSFKVLTAAQPALIPGLTAVTGWLCICRASGRCAGMPEAETGGHAGR